MFASHLLRLQLRAQSLGSGAEGKGLCLWQCNSASRSPGLIFGAGSISLPSTHHHSCSQLRLRSYCKNSAVWPRVGNVWGSCSAQPLTVYQQEGGRSWSSSCQKVGRVGLRAGCPLSPSSGALWASDQVGQSATPQFATDPHTTSERENQAHSTIPCLSCKHKPHSNLPGEARWCRRQGLLIFWKNKWGPVFSDTDFQEVYAFLTADPFPDSILAAALSRIPSG